MAEPIPQSQLILNQLMSWLGSIRQANGDYTDAGLDVRAEQTRDSEPDAPCLYLLDDDATWNPPSSGTRGYWTQSYTLEGLIRDDGSGRADARALLTDIHRALRRKTLDWPAEAGVMALRETARSIPPRPQNSDWLTPSVNFEIDFVDKEA